MPIPRDSTIASVVDLLENPEDYVSNDGVRALMERDAAVDRWLREEVAAGHAEYLADPSKGVPADAILNRIKARRR